MTGKKTDEIKTAEPLEIEPQGVETPSPTFEEEYQALCERHGKQIAYSCQSCPLYQMIRPMPVVLDKATGTAVPLP